HRNPTMSSTLVRRPRRRLRCEPLESRLLLAADPLAQATPLDLAAPFPTSGVVGPSDPVDYFRADAPTGRLELHLISDQPGLRLSLLDASGRKLIDSGDSRGGGTEARIAQHVSGVVYAAVQGQGLQADATYELTTLWAQTSRLFDPLPGS